MKQTFTFTHRKKNIQFTADGMNIPDIILVDNIIYSQLIFLERYGWNWRSSPNGRILYFMAQDKTTTFSINAKHLRDATRPTINGGKQMKNRNQIVELMDDEIREELHAKLAPCSDDEFLEAYKAAHLEKYGEEFIVN